MKPGRRRESTVASPGLSASSLTRHLIHYTSNDEVPQEFSVVVIAIVHGGEPTTSDESSEVIWVPGNELYQYPMDRSMRHRLNQCSTSGQGRTVLRQESVALVARAAIIAWRRSSDPQPQVRSLRTSR